MKIKIKNKHLVKEFFGMAKSCKKSAQELKDEMRGGW